MPTRALVIVLLAGLATPVFAQVTIPHTFSANTTILSAEVNNNFATLGAAALNRTGGTMTGALTGTSISLSSTLAVTGAATFSSTIAVTGTSTLGTVTAGAITVSGNFLPNTTNVRDLGSSAARFDELFVRSINASTTSTLTGAVTAQSTLAVTGATTLSSTLSVAGAISDPDSDLSITDNVVLTGHIYDSDSALTIADTLSVTGFGTHSFSAGSTGPNILQIVNTSAGTGNYGEVTVGADGTLAATLRQFSSTFTSSGPNQQSGATLSSSGAGGLSINTGDASGDIRLYTANTERARFDDDGGFTVAGTGGDATQTGTRGILISGNDPYLDWHEADGTSNEKFWRMGASADTLKLTAVDDAFTTTTDVLTVSRTATTLTSIAFPDGLTMDITDGEFGPNSSGTWDLLGPSGTYWGRLGVRNGASNAPAIAVEVADEGIWRDAGVLIIGRDLDGSPEQIKFDASDGVVLQANGSTVARASLSSGFVMASATIDAAGYLNIGETSGSPSPAPTQDTQAQVYVKADKFIIRFDNAGTLKYWYLDLTSTAGTWTYTTSAP